jgi:methanogenic corrinoid protein MtbC1
VVDQPAADGIVETLQRCMREHDREEAVRVVLAAIENGLEIEDLYTNVLEPFLGSVGRGWQEGRVAVWEEHLVVGAVRTAIEALYPRVLQRKAQVRSTPLTVAFFCPPEEIHDLGLRMLADRFDLRGYRTVYVGAMTPVDQMVECVRTVQASVVCVSASTHFQRTALRNVVDRLRRDLPDVRIVVGGPAFAHSECGWKEHAVESVDSLFGELTPRGGTGVNEGMAGDA